MIAPTTRILKIPYRNTQWRDPQPSARRPLISLVLGAANERALGFYRHLGYRDEDVRLVRLLD
jgi:hypothetical protein